MKSSKEQEVDAPDYADNDQDDDTASLDFHVSAKEEHFRMPDMTTVDDDAPSASFRLRHPLENVGKDVAIYSVVVACVLSGCAWLLKRRRRVKHDVSKAFVWQSEAKAASSSAPHDFARPLTGKRLVVNENVPVRERPTSLGVSGLNPPSTAPASHALVTTLEEAGASLIGAAKLDPLGISGPFQTLSCERTGNPGHPGRCLLGSSGACAVAVASGAADFAVGNDMGGEMLLAAACSGMSAIRTSVGSINLSGMLRASDTLDAGAFLASDATTLQKVGKAANLPGSGTPDSEVHVIFATDLFEMIDPIGGEKVTNGIASQALMNWIADVEDVRQVVLSAWLAKTLKWDHFAEDSSKDPRQVMVAIHNAHSAIVGFETAKFAKKAQVDITKLPMCASAHVQPALEVSEAEYERALELRLALNTLMRKALKVTLLAVPVIAGAPPPVSSHRAPLDEQATLMAQISLQFSAFIAMCGFPTVVLPVPALTKGGAPWSIAFVGLPRSDQQLLGVAAKLAPQIVKTAEQMGKTAKAKKATAGQEPLAESSPKAAPVSKKQAEKEETERMRNTAKGLKDKGNALFSDGKYIESIQMYTAAINHDSKNPVYYNNRAQAYLKLGEYERAATDGNSSITLAWSVKAAMRRGTALAALLQWQLALKDFKSVLLQEPNNKAVKVQIAECERMLESESAPPVQQETVAPVEMEGLI